MNSGWLGTNGAKKERKKYLYFVQKIKRSSRQTYTWAMAAEILILRDCYNKSIIIIQDFL